MPGKSTRLFALDFFRGLCLILMTMDHLPSNILWRFSNPLFGPFGFFTTASAFVFISGMASAKVYGDLYDTAGALATSRRVLRRALQLYVVNTTLLLSVLLGIGFHWLQGKQWEEQFHRFFIDPDGALLGGVLLLYRPGYFDILPMYALFFVAIVPVLAAMRRGLASCVVALSALTWLFAQISYQPREAFNPLGYQVLFVFGLGLGRCTSLARRFLESAAASKIARLCAMAALAFFLSRLALATFETAPDIVGWRVLTHVENNGPIRLLNFALVAFLLARVWTRLPMAPLIGSGVAQWIAGLGRHSLPVFAWSLAATYTSIALLPEPATRTWRLMDLLLTTSSLAVPAFLSERIKQTKRVNGLVGSR